jgi:hypothetical protein
MRLIIKLVIAALVANAAWHVGTTYAAYYKFNDAVKEATLFGAAKSDDQMKQRVLELASQFDVPLAEDNVKVRRDSGHTFVDGSYTRIVELFPGVKRPWAFEVHIDTLNFEGTQPR